MNKNYQFRMENIYKTYVMGSVNVEVLRGLSICVEKGTTNAVIGPSGSGKSTFLNILGTMDTPTSGEYQFEGRSVSGLSDRERTRLRAEHLGFVFQNYNLIPSLNVFHNVAVPLHILHEDRKTIAAKVGKVLEEVGLSHRRNHHPSELSGGERQRVAIARAILKDCSLIIADEPTGNLDEKTSIDIVRLLCRINEQRGTTLLVVTHDVELTCYFQTTFRMKDGRIAQESKSSAEAKRECAEPRCTKSC